MQTGRLADIFRKDEALRFFPSYEMATPRAWLFTIVRNTGMGAFRR
jgi:hypothetical protein